MKQRHNLSGLTKIGPTSWPSIWRRWSNDESQLKKWRTHFQREGYTSWASWRRAVVVAPFGLPRRRWALYHVTDPQVIVDWFGGPFPRWVNGPYQGAQTRTFKWLASSRASETRQPGRPKAWPKRMFMFGVVYRGRVVILDGMHRSVAIAKRCRRGQAIKTVITIALAETTRLPKLNISLK